MLKVTKINKSSSGNHTLEGVEDVKVNQRSKHKISNSNDSSQKHRVSCHLSQVVTVSQLSVCLSYSFMTDFIMTISKYFKLVSGHNVMTLYL